MVLQGALVREMIKTRFIEVKGRAAVGEITLTANEYKTAQRLGEDYWLYVVFNCASQPKVTLIQNPARFDWEPLSKIDCYRLRLVSRSAVLLKLPKPSAPLNPFSKFQNGRDRKGRGDDD